MYASIPRFSLFARLSMRKVSAARKELLDTAPGAALLALPMLGLFLAGLLSQEGIYASAGHGFSLVAALAAIGCVGHLASRISLNHEALTRACLAFTWLLFVGLAPEGSSPGKVVGPPPRPVILLRTFFVLFSGLGGWVEAREPRGPRVGTSRVVA